MDCQEELFRRVPGEARIGDGDAIAQLLGMEERLASLGQMALQDDAADGRQLASIKSTS